MNTLANVTTFINDTTGLNLSLQDLGLVDRVIPGNILHATINVTYTPNPNLAVSIVACLLLYFTMVFFHELGHLIALRRYYKTEGVTVKFGWNGANKWRIWTGSEWQFAQLTSKECRIVYGAGIFAGFIPIILTALVIPATIIMIVPYCYGLRTDIRLIRISLYGAEKVNEQNNRIKQWFISLIQKRDKSPKNTSIKK